MRICSDQGKEFENARFEEFYHSHAIQQEFSFPHYSSTKWGYRAKEQSYTRDGLSYDPFKGSGSTLLGRSYQHCLSYHE
jgi:hypothetical protein